MLKPSILVIEDEYMPLGESLASRLQVGLVREAATGNTYILASRDGLSFVSHLTKPHLKMHLNYLSGRIGYRLMQSNKEPIVKAFQDVPSEEYIFDATLGFAEDSVRLARIGHNIIAAEKNPFVFVLVEDALKRADIKNIDVRAGEAQKVLSDLDKKPFAVYLDPMFGIEKSAKTKKEMQVLQLLTDSNESTSDLFDAAMSAATHKVVVKRDVKAKPISDLKHQSIVTKTIRFDIYRK
ncbi:MAG: class I SAM-dependent methyltransferase [Bdellovibrionales bacterium]|nr:class I SAM-dependent methyltransferase [Bdellovibrionales bacterium]